MVALDILYLEFLFNRRKMARQSKKKKDLSFTGYKEVKKLWTSISPQDWLQLFQELSPDQQWHSTGISSIKGRCPYHDDATPSFTISFNKGLGKCFGDCGKTVVDLVNLVAKLKSISYTESLMLLNARFNLGDVLGEKSSTDLVAYNNIQEMKKHVAMAASKLIEEVVRDNPQHLDYCRPAIAYLIKGRELPIGTLPHMPVGVFGKPEHMKKYIDPTFHEIYDTYFKEYQNKGFFGAVMFHYNSSIGTISRFKFKKIDQEEYNKIEDVQDFMAVSKEMLRNLFSKVFIYVTDPYTEHMGVFGLNFYSRMLGRGDSNCYVTEGEFDVLSTMAQQILNEKIEYMVLGTGGKGSTNLGFLREYDIKTVWIISDTPAKKGDEYVLSILGDKHNYEQTLNAKSLTFKVFIWSREIIGMDLDEAMHQNDFYVINKFIYTDRNSTFLNSFPWVAEKCDRALVEVKREIDRELEVLDTAADAYPTQFTNINDERRSKIKDAILTWYNYIKDPADRVAFVQRYNTRENIDLAQLEVVNNSMYSLNSYTGVIKRMLEETLKYFTPAYYMRKINIGEIIYMWAHNTDNLIEFYGTDKNIYEIIAQHIGKPILDWFDEILGDNPVYLEFTGEKELESAIGKRKAARILMQHVWEHMRAGVKHIEDLASYSQGIQYYDLPDKVKNMGNCFFINGKHVYKGTFLEDDQMDWERLKGITDGDLLFSETRTCERWSSVSDITDLYEATAVDLKDVYNSIKILLGAWKFKNDEIMQKYLAAYIMSIPIMRAIGDINITFMTGEAESGKTSFTNGLLGGGTIGKGGGGSIESLLECTKFQTNLTPASLYQTFDGKSLLCVIDEADSSSANSKHANEQMQDVWKLMYSLPFGGSTVSRGGVTKDARVEYKIRMPVLMSAATTPMDPIFRSRVLFVTTVKEPGRTDPVDYMMMHYNIENLPKLKKDITIGLIPFIPKLIQLRNKLKQELPLYGSDLGVVSNRFVQCVLTPLTIYEFIGAGSAKELYKEITTANKDRLISLHGVDTQSEIINACLYHESMALMSDNGVATKVTAASLILKGEVAILNAFKAGIYFIEADGWIVIVWRQVKYTILRHGFYYRMEIATMRELASKNQFVVTEVTKEMHNYVLTTLGLADVKNTVEYTIITSEYLIRSELLPKKGATLSKEGVPQEELVVEEEVEEVVVVEEVSLNEDLVEKERKDFAFVL